MGVRITGDIRTDGKIFMLLEKPEQFDLGGMIEVSDFIEKKRSTRRLLDQAPAGLMRIGKRAFSNDRTACLKK